MYIVVSLLGMLSLIGIPITLVIFLIQLARKKSNKKAWGISAIVCLVLFIVFLAIPIESPTEDNEPIQQSEKEQLPPVTEDSTENSTESEPVIEQETTESEQPTSDSTTDDKTYVSMEEGEKLKEIAGEYAQNFANRPSTVDFDSTGWFVMRDDLTYTVEGYFTCDNGFGASEKYKINVICYMSEENELLVWMMAINDKPVVDNTEVLFGEQ